MTIKRIPITISGQTAIIEREAPDTCVVPRCSGAAVCECNYGVKVGGGMHRHCGARLCAKCARRAPGGNAVNCPSHQRLAEQLAGKVRLVP